MTRLVLLWPVSKDASAMAYADFADAAYAALTGNPEDTFVHRDWRDAHGQLWMAYFGPEGGEWIEGEPLVEPEGGEALRADATLVTHVDLPDEDE